MFELPTRRSIPPDLVQRISRLAGAYVENYGDEGKVHTLLEQISAASLLLDKNLCQECQQYAAR